MQAIILLLKDTESNIISVKTWGMEKSKNDTIFTLR